MPAEAIKYICTIKTPRATVRVHTVYPSVQKARDAGWGIWFEHEGLVILAKDNRSGAVTVAAY